MMRSTRGSGAGGMGNGKYGKYLNYDYDMKGTAQQLGSSKKGSWVQSGRQKYVSIKNMDISQVKELLVTAAKNKVSKKEIGFDSTETNNQKVKGFDPKYKSDQRTLQNMRNAQSIQRKKRDLKQEFRVFLKSIIKSQRLKCNRNKLEKLIETFYANNNHIWLAFQNDQWIQNSKTYFKATKKYIEIKKIQKNQPEGSKENEDYEEYLNQLYLSLIKDYLRYRFGRRVSN